jgi:hypothetical protein
MVWSGPARRRRGSASAYPDILPGAWRSSPRRVLRVDGRIAEAIHKERNAADVVEVTVRDEDARTRSCVLLEVLRVREDVVDAREASSEVNWKPDVEDEDVVVGSTVNMLRPTSSTPPSGTTRTTFLPELQGGSPRLSLLDSRSRWCRSLSAGPPCASGSFSWRALLEELVHVLVRIHRDVESRVLLLG